MKNTIQSLREYQSQVDLSKLEKSIYISIDRLTVIFDSENQSLRRIFRELRKSLDINSTRLDRSPGESVFPDIDTANLSPTRQKIISLAKTEFKAQSAGAKFSQGAEEAWCANFVSWIMYQAGAPLKNPHTGGWRIPGTFTLREYYEANGRFKPANSGYQPLPGDAAIYRNSPVFGDHTNIVLKNDNGVLTTVGGNEANRIRVFVNHDKQYDGLLGYGVPN